MIRSTDIESVLFNEIDNANQVIMYLEDDIWCAYERSAFYLACLKPSIAITKEVVAEGYDVILIKAQFPMDELVLPLSPGLSLKWVADGKLQFHMEETVDKDFPQWKTDQLNHL